MHGDAQFSSSCSYGMEQTSSSHQNPGFRRQLKAYLFRLAYLFIYLGFYVAFNTVQVISRRVVGRAEETSTYSSLGFCTVNCRPAASNYQLSHLRPCRESNPGLRGGRRECYHSATVAPQISLSSTIVHLLYQMPSWVPLHIPSTYAILEQIKNTARQSEKNALQPYYLPVKQHSNHKEPWVLTGQVFVQTLPLVGPDDLLIAVL